MAKEVAHKLNGVKYNLYDLTAYQINAHGDPVVTNTAGTSPDTSVTVVEDGGTAGCLVEVLKLPADFDQVLLS